MSPPKAATNSGNDLVTMNVQLQLNAVAVAAAEPRILPGKISPIMSQGIGPNLLKLNK
jgi:hypothetical protein